MRDVVARDDVVGAHAVRPVHRGEQEQRRVQLADDDEVPRRQRREVARARAGREGRDDAGRRAVGRGRVVPAQLVGAEVDDEHRAAAVVRRAEVREGRDEVRVRPLLAVGDRAGPRVRLPARPGVGRGRVESAVVRRRHDREDAVAVVRDEHVTAHGDVARVRAARGDRAAPRGEGAVGPDGERRDGAGLRLPHRVERVAVERQERRRPRRGGERTAPEGAGARGRVDVELDAPHALRAARVRVGADPEGAGRGGHAPSLVLRAGGSARAPRRTRRGARPTCRRPGAPVLGETTRQCAASYAVWISWEMRPRSLTV